MPESSVLSSYEEQRFLGKPMTRFFVFACFTLLITANEKKVLIVLAALKTYSRLVRTSSRVGIQRLMSGPISFVINSCEPNVAYVQEG